MRRHPLFEPELCATAAGLGLAALDAGLLLAGPHPVPVGPLRTALVLPLFAALLTALLWRLSGAAARLLGGGRAGRLIVGGALAIPAVIYVSLRLFQGTGISRRWYAPYGPYLLAPILLVLILAGVALGARLLPGARGSRGGRVVVGALLLAGAVVLGLGDRRLYPNQYAYLHALLLLGTGAALLGAAWLALPLGPGRWRWLGPAGLAAGLAGSLLAATSGLHGQREMQLLAERTYLSGRLAAVVRELLDRDGDHYSIVFGERDCDNGSPAVHPFAVDIPGNGVDEDCDGKDASPPPPPRPSAAPGLDEYGRRLARLRRRPDVRSLLQRTAGYSVMLVVVDALRADQVLPTDENRQNHPHLSALLGASRSFVRAFSAGAGTDIGMATVFTGRLDPFARHYRSLFQAYQREGVRTHGVFQREVERWVGRQFSLEGLQSRKVVINDPSRRDVGTEPTSRQVTEEGIRFLRQRASEPERFFLWLHYFDTHEYHQIDPARVPPAYRAPRGRPFYRGLLRFVDEELGRVLEELERSGLAGRTMIVVLGDHGESLGESPRLPANHGDVLFNPLVHVPLALRVPGLSGGAVQLAVSLADVAPTLLDLSGIAPPEGGPGASAAYGISLLPYLLEAAPEGLRGFVRPVVMYETRQRALLLWPWKFIAWQDSGRVELYQLERDFAEEHNLADEEPERAREMARRLAGYRLVTVDRLTPRR